MKYCEVGEHEVEKLWIAKGKYKQSACQYCASRTQKPLKPSVIEQITKSVEDVTYAHLKIYTAISKAKSVRKNNAEKSIPELIKLATIVFNRWVKNRDSHNSLYVCISCDKFGHASLAHAGHYLSAGNNSSVRFNEHNVNLQCPNCNINLYGNVKAYRINLVNKIGLQAVNQLEIEVTKPHKWDKSELLSIIERYK